MRRRRTTKQVRKSASTAGHRYWRPATAALLAVIVIGSIGYAIWGTIPKNGKPPVGVNSQTPAGNPSAAQDPLNPEFHKLKGRWLRPDGGYIVEVTKVTDGGAMEASYYNPNPIHVSRSEASWDGAAMTVFIELRDTHYPGCTYRLVYLPASDELAGIYYQAAIQQEFEVVFQRMK